MAQEQIQEQRLAQQQKLAQTITQQQLLQAQLIELPITQLTERVNAEMDDNPALEISTEEEPEYSEFSESSEQSDSADSYEQEERQSALDAALESIGRDDEELPVYHGGMSNQEEREEMVYGQSQSFYD
ncbi:MAG: RNA polymerase sigma-54 factor, partial [Prevotella sp.]|nr:RNA polymerase sigma-54 factor [Prevotella sp.]